MCTIRRRIPARASTYHGPEKGDLIRYLAAACRDQVIDIYDSSRDVDQFVFFNYLDLYHTLPDSGVSQYKSRC